MKQIRIKLLLLAVLALLIGLAGCASTPAYKDGSYTAEAADFDEESGWKDIVQVTVSGGKITAVDWNAVHRDGGLDKKALSESGQYGMVAGGAKSEWHEQARSMEAELVRQQDPAKLNIRDGKADGISGVSMNVSAFAKLSAEALAQAK